MAVHTKIQTASVEDLFLDPKNPRLGRRNVEKNLSQLETLALMQKFTLDEIGTSIVASGFWPQEAVIVVQDRIGRTTRNVVVEGNRRLAALKMLQQAVDNEKVPEPWKSLVGALTRQQINALKDTLGCIPCIRADSREDVRAYLGFQHVTGIKQWEPAEKAEYINSLIDAGLTYKEVTDQIGSKVGHVRQAYLSYRILLQMEEQEGIYIPAVE